MNLPRYPFEPSELVNGRLGSERAADPVALEFSVEIRPVGIVVDIHGTLGNAGNHIGRGA